MERNHSILFLIAFSCILLVGCDEKEMRLSRMCNCMGKKQEGNSNAVKEILGNNINMVMANAEAVDCAQQIQNEDNLTYSEMVGLFQEFTKSSCGKQYGVDAASLDEATKNIKQEINVSAGDTGEENNPFQKQSAEMVSADTSYNAPIVISGMHFKNGAANDSKFDNFTDEFKSAETKYVIPMIDFKTARKGDNGKVELLIRIIDENGNTLNNTQYSPDGFTMKYDLALTPDMGSISDDSGNALMLTGWGSDKSPSYLPGNYKVQIWYQNRCLFESSFKVI